jgi:hypothetical protein
VYASVVRGADQSLYLVDGNAPESPHRVRLLRISLVTGESVVLGTWPAVKAIDRYFLASTLDDEVTLLASSSMLPWFVGGVLAWHDGALRMRRPFAGKGQAILPVMATRAGLKVAVLSAKHRIEQHVFRTFAPPVEAGGDDDGTPCEQLFH